MDAELPFLIHLNEEQRAAVTYPKTHSLLVLAGAGSGRAGGLTVAGAGQSGPDARAFR